MSYLKTAILLAGLTALFVGVGYLIGGPTGMVIALVLAAGDNLFSYWNSDKMVLSMYGAHEVDRTAAPASIHLVARWPAAPACRCRASSSWTRRSPTPSPPAAIRRTPRSPDHRPAAPARRREELAGVMAHELAHVKNHDTLTMTITATIAGAISMLANFAMFFGGNRERPARFHRRDRHDDPGAAWPPCWCRWRSAAGREYDADDLGARICRPADVRWRPRSRRSTLRRAAAPNMAAERNPATAHMFIINPLSGRGVDNLFSTHPSTENRIAALQQLAAEMGAQGGTLSVNARGNYPRRSPWGRPSASRGPWG